MDDQSSLKTEIAKEIAKNVPVEKVYDDLFSPPLSELGQLLRDSLAIARMPIKVFRSYLEGSLQEYIERKKIAKEKLKAPAPEIAAPAVLALSYDTREEIKKMYIDLLGASMNVDTADFVHPSYVEIIKQLLPDEARLLKQLPGKGLSEPLVNITVEKQGAEGRFLVHRNCGVLGFEANCDIPENIPIYLDNLLRLSLVNIPGYSGLADEWRYDKILNSEYYQNLVKDAETSGTVVWEPRMVGLTDYGAQFRDICLS